MVVVCLFLCLSIKKNPVAKLDQRKTNFICIKMNLWFKSLYVVPSDLQQYLFWNRMETKTRKWHIGLILPIFPNLQDENNAFLNSFRYSMFRKGIHLCTVTAPNIMSVFTSLLHDLVQISLVRLIPRYTRSQATLFRQWNELLTLLVRQEVWDF